MKRENAVNTRDKRFFISECVVKKHLNEDRDGRVKICRMLVVLLKISGSYFT